MTKILVDKLPATCADCPLYQAPIIIPMLAPQQAVIVVKR